MSRDTASRRDMSLNALAVLTGGLTAAAFVGTGLLAGLAADYTAQIAQAKEASKTSAASVFAEIKPQPPVATPRPTRTVVTTRYRQAKPPAAGPQLITRASGRVSTVRAYRKPASAPAPQRARGRAAAPAPSAAS